MFKQYLSLKEMILEHGYPGNIGFIEMVNFYKKASASDKKEMKEVIDKGDWNLFKKLIKKVLNIDLV